MGGWGPNKIRRHFWKMLVKLFFYAIFSCLGFLGVEFVQPKGGFGVVRKVSFTS